MSYYKIWIPSQQKYYRFKEISIEQYRNILKCIDDDDDFLFCVNNLLIENSFKESFFLDNITIIDRFLILLQLKIHSCGSFLKLTRICDKCQEKTDFSLNLNDMIDKLAISLDKSFEKQYNFDSINIICDVPTIKETNDVQNDRIDYYLYSFIKKLLINDKTINLIEYPFSERTEICNNIYISYINYIKDNYIEGIHKIFSDLLITQTECSNKDCKDVLSIKFDINNLTDVCKLLFRDSSNANILTQYANLSMNCYFDFEVYKNICPAELNILENIVKNNMKTPQEKESTNKDINLFEQYNIDGQQSIETPSEFM